METMEKRGLILKLTTLKNMPINDVIYTLIEAFIRSMLSVLD